MSKFKIENDFIVRTPYCSFNIFSNELESVNEENLKKLLDKINFNETLLSSSNNLYKSILNSEINEDIYESCTKYLIRASTRCTPYGLNSAIMRGKIENYDSLLIDDCFLKYAKPDIEWMVGLIHKLENIISEQLNVTLNNTLKYNNLTIEKMWNSYYCTETKNPSTTIINNTNAVKIIFNYCKDRYLSIAEIINELSKHYKNLSHEYLLNFIMTLLNKEFLTSDLRPCLLVTNQYEFLLEKLEFYKIDQSIMQELKDIQNLLNKYNNIEVSKGEKTYLEIVNKMSKINIASDYIAIDMYQNNIIKIDKKKLDNIVEFSEFLVSWGLVDTYNQYISKFIEKYGNQSVKYLDLIDEEIGLGHPKKDKENPILLKDSFYNSFLEIIINQNSQHEIDISNMKKNNSTFENDPISFQLALYPFNKCEQTFFAISPLVGAKGLDKLNGRFKYIFENQNDYTEILDSEIQNVEITYPAYLPRHANVQITIPTSKYILEVGTNTEMKSFYKITLDDIYVFIDDNNIIRFMDIKSKKILLFNISSAYNQINCPDFLKPLLDLSDKQFNAVFTLYNELLHIITNIDGHFPRIVYKNIIIFPESWKLDKDFFNKKGEFISYNEFNKKFKEFKNVNHLPKIITTGPFDQKLVLNTEINVHIRILYSVLKNNPKSLIFEYNLNESNIILKNNKNEPYIGEFIFNIYSIKNSQNIKYLFNDIPSINYNVQKTYSFLPFKKWISLKLYMEKSTNNDFLRNQVYDLHNILIANNCADEFYYLRYKDPCQHIRLRIKFKENKKIETFKIIDCFIDNLNENNLITNCIIDKYEQEFIRYGGQKNIELAEKWFTFDSIVCMNLLRLKKQKNIKYNIETMYILSSFRILLDTEMNLNEQIKYLSDYRLDKNETKKFRELRDVNFLQETINHNMQNMLNNQEDLTFMIILEESSFITNKYWKEINKSCLSDSRKKTIICSLLHMHFNRLIGIDRAKENELISYLRKMLYIKHCKIKYMQNEN